jgi:ketosteroid isomerase-like protein
MGEHSNLVVAQCLWDAIARADAPALRELMSEKTVWRMPGNSPLAGTYVGVDAILQFMARVGDLADDLRSDLIDVFVNDRGAVLRYDVHAIRGIRSLDIEHLFMIRIDEGRITEGVFAPIDQHRYDRFFSGR